MSRWLANVGQFLERLDNQAKDVVEERLISISEQKNIDDDNYGHVDSGENIDNILAARGLLTSAHHDDDDNDHVINQNVNETVDDTVLDTSVSYKSSEAPVSYQSLDPTMTTDSNENIVESEPVVTDNEDGEMMEAIDINDNNNNEGWDDIPSPEASMSHDTEAEIVPSTVTQPAVVEEKIEITNETSEETKDTSSKLVDEHPTVQSEGSLEATDRKLDDPITPAKEDFQSEKVPTTTPFLTPAQYQPEQSQQHETIQRPTSSANLAPTVTEEMVPLALLQTKLNEQQQRMNNEHQKDIRKLKRNIVSLNTQLEATESEMIAQRKELENAAQLMEKDRNKNKDAIEALKAKYTAEMSAMKSQHDTYVSDLQRKYDEQMQAVQEQFRQLEMRRRQEGGDFSKELTDAIQREQEIHAQYNLLLDEKETLLQQIGTLQNQQEALGLRLESLSNSAEAALQREHEAERRLDEALELHAKQIIQRQTREAELERSVAELGAALVALRNNSTVSSYPTRNDSVSNSGLSDQSAGDVTSQGDLQQIHLQTLDSENEALRSQLAHEVAKSTALEKELQEVTKERAEEAIQATRTRQQHDRVVAELNQQITQLRSETSGSKTESPEDQTDRNDSEFESKKRIKQLSDEIHRQREKISSYSSEISTLRTRLNVALNRATVAEAVAEQQQQQQQKQSFDLEGGGVSSPYSGNSTYGKNNKQQKRGRKETIDLPSMRKALMIDNDPSSNSAQIGTVLDSMDSILSKTGRVLRVNPYARLFFVVYIVGLHLWTFVVIFFHAHHLDKYQNASNAIALPPHGPQAIIANQQQLPLGDILSKTTTGN